MEPVAISWLVASATSPLIAVLALWTVYVFHTYRKRWRTVDLFLLTVAAQELVAAVFTFGYAIISLINPPITALCSFIQWGLISIRTFQIATLTSMVVDRALTVRWPYRYRFSVRRNQIRYHIAVLVLMAILVGVAAVFAHHIQEGRWGVCSGHPGEWDFKFVVFMLGFYGVLLLVSVGCAAQIEIHKCRNGGGHEDKSRPFQLPDSPSSDLPVPISVTSPLDNDSHTGSTKALHRPYRHSSRRPYGKRGANRNNSDFRWPPVAVVSLVCFSVNHLPYLVLTSLAMAMPWLWSPWHEALLSWLRLAEGVLVPLILCLVDQHLRTALKRTFQRRSGALSPLVGDDGPFQMYFDKDHFRKRGTFGSVTPIGIITNYRRTPGKKRRNRKSKYKLPGLNSGDSVIEKSCLAGSFLSTEPLSKLSCADLTSLEVWQEEDEENFYATLSDDFSNFSTNSADDSTLNQEAKICEDLYGGSFTTIANDDFEFHDTRPCGGEVRMKPSLTEPVRPVNSFRSSTRSGFFSKDKSKMEEFPKCSSIEKLADLMNITLKSDDDKKVPDFFLTDDGNTLQTEPDIIKTDDENTRSPASLSKATSFSLNDLDLIDNDDGSEKEQVFVLPVKSESTMSLYRLHLDKNIENFLSVTKSESNINGDSGFGSGTQTMNPIWPGYPMRKVSDPLSNHRKPILSPGCVSNKNYPCILHPRMQRIPWISAWKKLGGNGESSDVKKNRKSKDSEAVKNTDPALRMLLINDNFELRQRDAFQWKDSIIYARDDNKKHGEVVYQSSNITNFNENAEEFLYGSSHYKERHRKYDQKDINNKKDLPSVIRKESFKESSRKTSEECPYGRINEWKIAGHNEEDTIFPPEENIYEEIISNKSSITTDHLDTTRKDPSIDDKSYAQTDILKLVNVNENLHGFEFSGNANRKTNEFKLNININPSIGMLEPRPLNYIERLPVLSEDLSSNVSNFVINCTPLTKYDNDVAVPESKFKENRNEKDKTEINYNSRVHVAYNVNASALEFIDKSEEDIHKSTPYESTSKVLDEDLNANSLQNHSNENHCRSYDFKIHGRTDIPVICRKENHIPRYKDTNLKRRESKKNKSDDPKEIPDVTEVATFNKTDNFSVTNRDKSREVKRRESGSRIKRESHIPRRESDHRHKKPRSSSSCQESALHKKPELNYPQKKDGYNAGLWPKEHARSPENLKNRDVSRTKTSIHLESQLPRNVSDHYGYGEFERTKRCNRDQERHQSSGVIRLHCNYPEQNRNSVENINRIVTNPVEDIELSHPIAMRNNDVSRIHVQNRNCVYTDVSDCPRGQHRMDYVELYRKDSARERKPDVRLDRQKRHDVERRESDNRIRRKVSGSRERREQQQPVEKKESFKDGSNGKRRIRKTDGLAKPTNHVRRTNSFQTARETNANLVSPNIDELNRNESVKLNTEVALGDENVRMDNLVYGRKENGNLVQDAEIFPFETFVKPPSYNNLMKYQAADRSETDYRDRCKQKKIAITDYL